jgi:hypothetical protein
MSDEISMSQATIMVKEVTAPPAHHGIYEHWCMHTGFKRWGSFGYDRRFGTVWFCDNHKSDGTAAR